MSVEGNRGIEKYQQVPPGQQGESGERRLPPIFKELSDGNFWAIPLEGDKFAVIKYPTSSYTNFDHYGGKELFDVQAVEGKEPLTGEDLKHRRFSSVQWELVQPAIVGRSGQELKVLHRGELDLGEVEPR